MISYIKGEIIAQNESSVVVLTNGIGYEIFLPGLRSLSYSKGQEAEFFVYLYLREDSLQLYGFSDWQEREIFVMLITVSGIGPKAALAILGELTSLGLYQAVVQENVNLLTKVPGIGKKTAQRLVLELKDKLAKRFADELAGADVKSTEEMPALNTSLAKDDVFYALEALGYQEREIRKIYPELKPLIGTLSEQEIIKKALTLLMQG